MPRPLPIVIRRAIISAYSRGDSFVSIARQYEVGYQTVRRLCRRYDQEGESGLTPRYSNCKGPKGYLSSFVYRAARFLKHHHPGWGAEYILVLISEHNPEIALPHPRTVYGWFKQMGHGRPNASYQPTVPTRRARGIHDVWQLDAKEKIQLSDGTQACWLSITDEYSGGILSAVAFPPGRSESGTPFSLRDAFNPAFSTLGNALSY